MKQVQITSKFITFSLIIFVIFNISCRQYNASHYFKNGSAKYQLENYKSAVEDLDQAIELENDYIDAYYVRALCYSSLKKYDKAVNDFNMVIELNPDYKDAYINRGFYILEKRGDFEGAISDYNKYLELNKDGDNAFAYNNRGYAKYKLNDFDGAMKDIQESIQANPENSLVYKNRALIYLSIDSINLACKDLELANKLGFTEEYGSEVIDLISKVCPQD